MGKLGEETPYPTSSTLMNKKIHNLVAAVVMLSMPMIYFYGVFSWQAREMSDNPNVVDWGKHLYFVSFSSAMYSLSFALFLIAKENMLKFISSFVSSVCAVILYQEIRYWDEQWTQWSYWNIVIVSANYLLLYCIIEKYKKLIKQ